MSKDEFKTYCDLYEEFIQLIPPPNLMIYIRAHVDTLIDRIQERGRPEEQKIPKAYMNSLYTLYESWFEKYDRSSKLVIDVDNIDFVHSSTDRQYIVDLVRTHLQENFEFK
jgi:deoxyadenosine/deoxycytidine kinase